MSITISDVEAGPREFRLIEPRIVAQTAPSVEAQYLLDAGILGRVISVNRP
jgi:hypothetical protein